MSRPPDATRRALLGGLAAGIAGAVVRPAQAAAQSEAAPGLSPDPSRQLGAGSTPLSERSPFADDARLVPTDVATGASFSPIHRFFGTITPSDLQFQRHHAGIAQVDPAHWRLLVHGLVERPLMLTLDELERFPPTTRVHFLECAGNGRAAWRAPKPELSAQQIDGLVANLEWTGVRLATVLREVGVGPEASWIGAEGGDGSRLSRSVPIGKALDDALLVYASNGEALRPAHGFPVRLLLPGFEANMSIKWLRRLELRRAPLMARDETVKYTEMLADGSGRQFSFVQDCKSIITSPSYPESLSAPGWWPISGLAWSGRGRVQRVEVSVDGGATWADAAIEGTPLSKAQVRFSLPWQWTGREAVLMSRATDETGYVQPSAALFREVRGPGTDYHFNAIRAWRVAEDGAVTFRPDPEAA